MIAHLNKICKWYNGVGGTMGSGPNVPLVDNFVSKSDLSTVGTLGPDPIVPTSNKLFVFSHNLPAERPDY